jgi:glycosyltransferase involved in cell wall biosynthesis
MITGHRIEKHERASVSVIIPCYCCADTIGRAVDSVMAQSLLPEEIILIDDFSNDSNKTLNVLENLLSLNQEVNIIILRLDKNSGPGSARNAGWAIATQPYIAFLDADDSWHPKKLEIQYKWMTEHSDAVMSGHATAKILTSDVMPNLTYTVTAFQVNANRLLYKNYFPTRSVMLKCEISYRFVEGKRYAEDLLLWLTIAFNGNPVWRLNLPMAYSYKEEFGEGGLTGNLWKTQQGVLDAYHRLFMNGFISFFLFGLVSTFSLLKYLRRLVMVKWRLLFNRAS